MYFKKLEIFGFKSFADKTVLNFEPGITAVIGPNGCGKSNVFDAIRWVLGEQSVKELRGASMEDVIFNGTDKREALGFAEVNLTFSNELRALPVDYNEVTITRRLFRSGESEYLMNKTQVRLKDILELFMGTGVGAEAYSLVQQGKVDLIVNAKPEERRMVLDEASGITKYKSKKKEALSKLKDTESNLLRINDIVIEVKRQISSLERQARKAQRYKDGFEKLKKLEVAVAGFRLDAFKTQRQQILSLLNELRNSELKTGDRLKELNNLLENDNNQLENYEEQINDAHAKEIKQDGEIDINTRQILFNEERIQNVSHSESRLNEKKGQLIERCRLQQEKLDEIKKALFALDETMQDDLQKLQEKRVYLSTITSSVKDAHDAITGEEENVLRVTSRQVHIKNKLTELMKEIQGGLARQRRLDVENNKVMNEKRDVDVRQQEMEEKIESSENGLRMLRDDLSIKSESLSELMSRVMSLDEEINDLEKKKLFLISQKEFIEKLSVQYQDMPDPIVEGKLYTDIPPNEQQSGIIGKVKAVEKVDDERYATLRRYFRNDPISIYEIVCETKFIELDPQQISLRVDDLSGRIEEKISDKNSLLAQADGQKNIIGHLEFDLQEQEKSLSICKAHMSNIQQESSKLTEELELINLELDEVVETLSTVKSDEKDSIQQLDGLNGQLMSSQLIIKEKQSWISSQAKKREETTVSIAQLETEVSSVEDRRISHIDNLSIHTETLDGSLDEIKNIEEEFIELGEKKEQFQTEIGSLQIKIEELKDQKTFLVGELKKFEMEKKEVATRIESVRSEMSQLDQKIDDNKNTIHAREMNEQEIVFKEKEIKDRLMQAYKIDWETYIVAMNSPEETKEEGSAPEVTVNQAETEAEIERLRKRCDSFGSVNLVAIEEYEELKERFEFLTRQQSDLISAKESLHQTIRKINRQTRQMFMDTFTKVSEEFRIYFRMLFGGGDAQLIIVDPDNVLESGIDIIARPPGKKLQNISLLSGGEKTLTAIALIFGVFKVNPSPFCVLDEIDAALDESNVGRFSYLLQDFAKIAQFIVITHNKKTISSADVLYGITMQETGVSRVVSVKFEEKSEESTAKEELPTVV